MPGAIMPRSLRPRARAAFTVIPRHTFASLLISGGASLPIVGKLLGHTQAKTTQRYAHPFDDPVRQGVDAVGDMLGPKLRLVSNEALPDQAA